MNRLVDPVLQTVHKAEDLMRKLRKNQQSNSSAKISNRRKQPVRDEIVFGTEPPISPAAAAANAKQ